MSNRVSVIIPTLNEEKYISTILSDLSQQTFAPHEVIVVDGNSRDQTTAAIRQFRKVKLLEKTPQVAEQRNSGAEEATGEVLIFLDADTHVTSSFIEKIVTEFEKKKLDIAIPRYTPINSIPLINGFFIFFNRLFYLFQKISPSGAGCGIIIKKEVFDSHGKFNREYTYDDIELIRRVSHKGKYGILPVTVYVSDRRFKKYGLVYMISLYSVLSLLFFFNQFKLANKVKYPFGNF